MRGVPGTAKSGRTTHKSAQPGKGKRTFRWPQMIRIRMAVEVISKLSFVEMMKVCGGGPLPTHSQSLNAAYARVRSGVCQWLREVHRTPDHKMPSAAALRKAAQRNAIKLMRDGHVHDAPPHEKGYKMTPVRKGILKNIHTLLLKGYKTPSGATFPFRSLKHAVANSREIAALVQVLHIKRLTTVWRMLRTEFPDLYIGKLLTRKKRHCQRTQVLFSTRCGCAWCS